MDPKLRTTRFRRPFPPTLLHDGETTVVDLSPHWSVMLKSSFAAAACVLLAVAASLVTDWFWLSAVPLLAAAGAVGVAWLRRVTTYFVVTTDRVIFRAGILAKSGIEIPLERLNTVFFAQSLFERMLRCGDLTIESAGELGRQQFTEIPYPSAVQNAIYGAIETNSSRMYNSPAAPAVSMATELGQLAELHGRGVLNDAEYSAAKAKILGG